MGPARSPEAGDMRRGDWSSSPKRPVSDGLGQKNRRRSMEESVGRTRDLRWRGWYKGDRGPAMGWAGHGRERNLYEERGDRDSLWRE